MVFLLRTGILITCLSIAVLLMPGASPWSGLVLAESLAVEEVSTGASAVQALIGAWELVRKAENGGPDQPVSPRANTLMELTQGGAVMVTKTHADNPSKPDTRPGSYSVEGSTMLITDDQGNTARCEYRIEGDTLALAIPQIHKEFYWRRVK